MDISRQTEVFVPSDYEKTVNIIGCGATGSWVALMLAKMGVKKLNLIDMDIVEEHNIPNQFFCAENIEVYKSLALADRIRKESGYNEEEQHIDYHINEITEENICDFIKEGVVFCLVDSMEARKSILEGLKYKPAIDLFIDTRMGIDFMRIYTLSVSNADHLEMYEKTLCEDEESSESFCGVSQSIVATASMVASFAVWNFIQFVQNKTVAKLENETIFALRPMAYLQTKWDNIASKNIDLFD